MPSNLPRSREHQRLVARLSALCESYGCVDLAALEHDLDVVIRVEYLAFEKARKAAYERERRARVRGTEMPHQG